MINVILHGNLGKTFGKEWSFDAHSPSQVFSAIDANTDGFAKYLAKKMKEGISYRVFLDRAELKTKEQLGINLKNYKKMHIFPTAKGAGWADEGNNRQNLRVSGYGTVGMIVGHWLSGSDSGFWAGVGEILFEVGTAGVIQGAIGLLTDEPDPPEVPDLPETNKGSTSYIYSRAGNNVLQGSVVPIGYGRLKVGSKTISSSVLNARRLNFNEIEVESSDEDTDSVMIVQNQ